jgi:hypothetical protein
LDRGGNDFRGRSATVVVRIKNQGDNAYLQNEYGPSIIVERHFSKSGATGFRLKSSTGRVVSTKKADLDAITDFYALQMDNPMNVLSQDMARQFMGSSTPEEKYKFFVKGVQLQQLDQDYALIAEYSDQTEEKLRLLDEDVQVLLEKREKAKARLALANRHESLTEKIKSLRAQVAWAQVEEQELVGVLGTSESLSQIMILLTRSRSWPRVNRRSRKLSEKSFNSKPKLKIAMASSGVLTVHMRMLNGPLRPAGWILKVAGKQAEVSRQSAMKLSKSDLN